MAKEFHRADRVATAMRRELAQLIQQQVRDPRIGMVNINDIEVSRDLATAKVFVTLVGEEDRSKIDLSMATLNKAAGFLRSQLARALSMRSVPRMHFRYDETSLRGQRLSTLIQQAVQSDQQGTASSNDDPGHS